MNHLKYTLMYSVWSLPLALLFASGCDDVQKAKTDEEPTLAEYVVTVSPAAKEILLKPEDSGIFTSVEVRGQCVGEFVPRECASFTPDWIASYPLGATVTFDNPHSPTTLAFVRIPRESLQLYKSALAGTERSVYLTFTPGKKLPVNVARRRAYGRLDLNVRIPEADPPRQEVTPTEGHLTIAPRVQRATITGSESSTIIETTIRYRGPATTLRLRPPYDEPGGYSGSRVKFTVMYPPPVFPMPENGSVGLIVKFEAAPGDVREYRVGIEATVDSGVGADGIEIVFIRGVHSL